jgi:outer membrane receptor protein involved in Fe transport
LGAFHQRQTDRVSENFIVDNLAPDLSVNGRPGSVWLTLEQRKDQDWAVFAEGEFDVTPQLTVIAGGRLYRYNNSLFGFAGFGKNPNFDEDSGGVPPNAVGGSPGVRRCFTVNGLQLWQDEDSPFAEDGLAGTPCTNIGKVIDQKAVPIRSKGSGFTHRVSTRWKPSTDVMIYATWSSGFRPGGSNRYPDSPAYKPDYLRNYELGWKIGFGRLRWNGAAYCQLWRRFQFGFLGTNDLIIIQNGRDAAINGVETDVSYAAGRLSLNAAAAFTSARTKGTICRQSADSSEDCTAPGDYVVSRSHTQLPITPKLKATVTARYSWPQSGGTAHLQGTVAYRGSASADIRQVNDFGVDPVTYLGRLRASTVVNFSAGFDTGLYSAELVLNNLFNDRNETSRFVSCGVCERTYVLAGPPRTVGLRAGFKFDGAPRSPGIG